MINLRGGASCPHVAPYGASFQRPSCSTRTETRGCSWRSSLQRPTGCVVSVVGHVAGYRYCCRCSWTDERRRLAGARVGPRTCDARTKASMKKGVDDAVAQQRWNVAVMSGKGPWEVGWKAIS